MINIAKLLKDAPKGMKLYSPLFGEAKFVRIDKQSDYPIDVTDCNGNGKSFTEFGVYFADHPDAECLLFPSKECRTWENFELPIEPCFKVGDKIEATIYGMKRRVTIHEVDKTNLCYFGTLEECIGFSEQDQWHLAPKPHYDIKNFKPFDKVLVRNFNNDKWRCGWFSGYDKESLYSFITTGADYTQCIPFEGNEKLLGTTDMPDEMYINW